MDYLIILRHAGWNEEFSQKYANELKKSGFVVHRVQLGFPSREERVKIISMMPEDRKKDVVGILNGWGGVIRLHLSGENGLPPLPTSARMGFLISLNSKGKTGARNV